jgi:hypothetical protein
MGGRSGGQHERVGAVVGVGDHSARAAELDQGRVARQRGTGEARWGGPVRWCMGRSWRAWTSQGRRERGRPREKGGRAVPKGIVQFLN